MFFKDIIGKEKEKKTLLNQVKEERIPHAQILMGREGSGGLALALAYASYLLCEERGETDSCGQCKSCSKTHKLVHPDLHLTFPVSKKEGLKREETTSTAFLKEWRQEVIANPYIGEYEWSQAMGSTSKPNINTRECHDIVGKLGMQAYENGPKVLIIWLPEFLGKEGNRLLKLIEEPTDNTYIILVSEDSNKILATILSRCQLVKIPAFQDNDIVQYLRRHTENFMLDMDQVARLADGNLMKAITLARGNEADNSELLFEWLRVSYKSNALEMQASTTKLTSLTNDNQIQFLEYGLHFLREYMFWISTGQTPRMSAQEMATSQKMKSLIGLDKIESLCNALEYIIFGLNRNGNNKITFMAGTIMIGNILKNNEKMNGNILSLLDQVY